MTYHDKRLKGGSSVEGDKQPRKSYLLDGALSITLWPTMNRRKLGSVRDDWKAVGEDIRKAMTDARG